MNRKHRKHRSSRSYSREHTITWEIQLSGVRCNGPMKQKISEVRISGILDVCSIVCVALFSPTTILSHSSKQCFSNEALRSEYLRRRPYETGIFSDKRPWAEEISMYKDAISTQLNDLAVSEDIKNLLRDCWALEAQDRPLIQVCVARIEAMIKSRT